jgi:hypothetical protein
MAVAKLPKWQNAAETAKMAVTQKREAFVFAKRFAYPLIAP